MAGSNTTTKKKPDLTPDHKEAMVQGRTQARAVRSYLDALAANRPKRGRRRSPERLAAQLAKTRDQLENGDLDRLKRLHLVAESHRLAEELESMVDNPADRVAETEGPFIEVAAEYAKAHEITHSAFVELGVNPKVLAKAGVRRTRRSRS